MGRARGHQHAVNLAGFDAALGARRGVERGTVLACEPTEADRRELAQLGAAVDRGQFEQAWELLAEHHRQLRRYPLLGELHGRVCDRLSYEARKEFLQSGREALSSLGFAVEDDSGQTFHSEKLQDAFDAGMRTEVAKRVDALLKAGLPVNRLLADKAFRTEFVRVGAAQCFQNRERLCRDLLGADVPQALSDVTAWRALMGTFMDSPPGSRAGVADALKRAKATATYKPPAPRRRQRYVR